MDKEEISARRDEILRLMGMSVEDDSDDDLTARLLRDAAVDLAFMRSAIEDIQAELMSTGWQDSYQNGQHQSGTKTSPAAKVYIDLQKEYNSKVVRVFLPLIDKSGKEKSDALLDFVRS